MILQFNKWKLFCCAYNEMEEPCRWALVNLDGPWIQGRTGSPAPLQYFFDNWEEAWKNIWKN